VRRPVSARTASGGVSLSSSVTGNSVVFRESDLAAGNRRAPRTQSPRTLRLIFAPAVRGISRERHSPGTGIIFRPNRDQYSAEHGSFSVEAEQPPLLGPSCGDAHPHRRLHALDALNVEFVPSEQTRRRHLSIPPAREVDRRRIYRLPGRV
jgi:hypothetical protein